MLKNAVRWPGCTYRDQAYVTGETKRLAEQLAAIWRG
jgi:hypothetical protein